ncbi:MAG: S9 family peptidase [Bacteroidales bacterium]|nr:S9 family peptidase [Bacteroidales bacterium]
MKKIPSFLLLFLFTAAFAQQNYIPVPDNLVAEGIPPLPQQYIAEVRNYTETRSASLVDWNPTRKEMLITTRFGNSNQLHYVKFPGGDRKQITFFDEPISSARFQPVDGSYFLFLKDIGGNEFSQIYRFDLVDHKVTLLTDGKRSQNGGIIWNHKGDLIAYSSTKRNGQDRDIFIMNPLDPASERKILENAGGGWGTVDWSPNDSKLLVEEGISVNESRLYLVDVSTGTKSRLLPEKDERTVYSGICFSKDGKGIYLITNKEGEFNQLVYFDLATRKMQYITKDIPWDVEGAELSKDGSQLAFSTNENGLSKLYLLSTNTLSYKPVSGIPTGVFGRFVWSGDSKSIGLTFYSYNASADVYEYNTITGEFTRWTESELGGMDVSTLQEPELITWKTFDGKTISGYLYRASTKYTGKRPVIINIHGGPEGQSLPGFLGRSNYYLNELGVSMIYPNVRGSSGYGKTFVDLDNGMKREESVQDIGALIDWIAQQPDLDKDRIMVTGGSYGGYMTLAVSYLYSDKIRCSLDVVGISNFNTFMKNTEAYRRDLRRVEYGDERDSAMAAFFEAIAPMNHTDKIKKPLFIVQGGNDPRVPYTESIQMKEKIQQNGGTVWFLMAKDEGHGFRKKTNVDFQFYATIEFIKQFLLN